MAGRAGLTNPLVALHGFGDSGECLGPFLRRLRAPDAHTPDLLAHGGRAMPPGLPFSHESLVHDALAAVRSVAERSGRAVVLMGHSLGASTAVGVAAAAPGLVSALVLEDPPWQVPVHPDGDSDADRRAEQVNDHRPWLEGLQSTDHEGRVAWLRQNNPGWPRDEHDPWARAKAQVDLALFDAPQHWLRRTWAPAVEAVSAPALLMVGEPGRGAACHADVASHVAHLDSWRVQRVTGAGHNLRREQPDTVAAIVADLIGRPSPT